MFIDFEQICQKQQNIKIFILQAAQIVKTIILSTLGLLFVGGDVALTWRSY